MWIAGRDRYVGEWSQSGAVGEISCGGYWYATADKEEWPEPGTEPYEMLMADFDGEELCDRRQEIVFIGQGLKREAITAALDACLITKEDLKAKDADQHRKVDAVLQSGRAPRFGATAPQMPSPPRAIGADTDAVLAELGLRLDRA